nr:hypothetical protein [Tanacetum cinerariifolium]
MRFSQDNILDLKLLHLRVFGIVLSALSNLNMSRPQSYILSIVVDDKSSHQFRTTLRMYTRGNDESRARAADMYILRAKGRRLTYLTGMCFFVNIPGVIYGLSALQHWSLLMGMLISFNAYGT